MQSLKELYKIGYGPSSSHTMGPAKAAEYIKHKYSFAFKIDVILYGSLAFTGKGHLTDYIILEVLKDYNTNVFFNYKELPVHPNTMEFIIYSNNKEIAREKVISIGGGSISIESEPQNTPIEVYPFTSFQQIKDYCLTNNLSLVDFVYKYEEENIHSYFIKVYETMKQAITEGLYTQGYLPGDLHIARKASMLTKPKTEDESLEVKELRNICSYAYAVSEQNACGKEIVTAPTCGSSGVLPAILYYYEKNMHISQEKIYEALAVAGIIGNVVKTNASISGALAGCQSEIGTACSMAAAASAYLSNMNIEQIEYAAEIALEHHLGLTCDPVSGLVQIPCIERNAVAALRALDSARLSSFLSDSRKISFDTVVNTMFETGKDLNQMYKETSVGGLAKHYIKKEENN